MNNTSIRKSLSYLGDKYLNEPDNELFQQRLNDNPNMPSKPFLAELDKYKISEYSLSDISLIQDIFYYGS